MGCHDEDWPDEWWEQHWWTYLPMSVLILTWAFLSAAWQRVWPDKRP